MRSSGPARASGSSMSFQPSLHQSSCQGKSSFPTGQPARDGEVGGSRRVGASSETKHIQTQTNTYIYPAAVQQARRPAAAVGAPAVPLPPGQPAPAESGRCRVTSFRACFLFFLRRSDSVGNTKPETAAEQSILEIASRTRQSQRQQHVLPAKPPPEQLSRRAAPVPLSPPPPGLPARDGEVGGTCRVGARSETTYKQTRASARM